MSIKRHLKLKSYSGADYDPSWVSKWINEPGGEQHKRRICRLIEMLQKATRSPLRRGKPFPRFANYRAINKAVSRYVSRPDICINDMVQGRARFLPWLLEYETADDISEFMAFGTISDVLDAGKLFRFRRCELKGCGRWYFASDEKDQRFCPPPNRCRKKFWDSTPRVRRKNRDYQKWHYRLHLSPKKKFWRRELEKEQRS